jgi:hypothetical protein
VNIEQCFAGAARVMVRFSFHEARGQTMNDPSPLRRARGHVSSTSKLSHTSAIGDGLAALAKTSACNPSAFRGGVDLLVRVFARQRSIICSSIQK